MRFFAAKNWRTIKTVRCAYEWCECSIDFVFFFCIPRSLLATSRPTNLSARITIHATEYTRKHWSATTIRQTPHQTIFSYARRYWRRALIFFSHTLCVRRTHIDRREKFPQFPSRLWLCGGDDDFPRTYTHTRMILGCVTHDAIAAFAETTDRVEVFADRLVAVWTWLTPTTH